MTDSKPLFEVDLTRVIPAARARVYEAWTKPDQLTQWLAPKPFQLIVWTLDFRPGGRFRMAMRSPEGKDFPFTGTYGAIVRPTKLSWDGEFEGGPPRQLSTVVTFDETTGGTEVHVRQTFHVMTPMVEQATKGAQQGWTTTLDQLAAFCTGAATKNRIEQRVELKASPARTWRALADHREFGEWFRVALDAPFVAGEVSRGHVTYPGYEHLKWEAVVKKMEPEKVLSFTWHPAAVDPKADYSKEPPTLVEFQLEPTHEGTLLTITESGFDALPSGRRDEAYRMNADGWAEQAKNIEQHLSPNHS